MFNLLRSVNLLGSALSLLCDTSIFFNSSHFHSALGQASSGSPSKQCDVIVTHNDNVPGNLCR